MASEKGKSKFRSNRPDFASIAGLILAVIEGWAEACDQNQFDARNEATVKLMKKIVVATGDKYDRALPFI